jgi:hypothetical protein
MKAVTKKIMLRPQNITRRTPTSRTAAATELVRLEFERSRLSRDIAVLGERLKISTHELKNINSRIETLQGLLDVKKTSALA